MSNTTPLTQMTILILMEQGRGQFSEGINLESL